MSKTKYINVPLACLPETLTMVRPKKGISDEALYEIGADKALGHEDAVMTLMKQAVNQNFADILRATDALCLGVCQPQRTRKHVHSTEVKPKLLT